MPMPPHAMTTAIHHLGIWCMQRALLYPFRIALVKLNSQEAATLMAAGSYAEALPIAMDAVKEGQDIFKPQPDLRLFPLFLLGAQVRIKQLCMAGHVKHPFPATPTRGSRTGPVEWTQCILFVVRTLIMLDGEQQFCYCSVLSSNFTPETSI